MMANLEARWRIIPIKMGAALRTGYAEAVDHFGKNVTLIETE